jgi:hypothetical protein
MTMNLREKRVKEAAAIHFYQKINFRVNRRCFLHPNTPQKPVIPNESTLNTFRKLWV